MRDPLPSHIEQKLRAKFEKLLVKLHEFHQEDDWGTPVKFKLCLDIEYPDARTIDMSSEAVFFTPEDTEASGCVGTGGNGLCSRCIAAAAGDP